MSIFFVIHTQGSRLQKPPRGAESQPTTFFLSSCSHTVTKAREEVSHRAAVPLTRRGWGDEAVGEDGTNAIYTNKLDTHTEIHTMPLQIPRNILQEATFPHELRAFSPSFFSPSCQTGAHAAAHQHPSAQQPVCPMTTSSVLHIHCSDYTVK